MRPVLSYDLIFLGLYIFKLKTCIGFIVIFMDGYPQQTNHLYCLKFWEFGLTDCKKPVKKNPGLLFTRETITEFMNNGKLFTADTNIKG